MLVLNQPLNLLPFVAKWFPHMLPSSHLTLFFIAFNNNVNFGICYSIIQAITGTYHIMVFMLAFCSFILPSFFILLHVLNSLGNVNFSWGQVGCLIKGFSPPITWVLVGMYSVSCQFLCSGGFFCGPNLGLLWRPWSSGALDPLKNYSVWS